jgi:hypothetical protein
VVLVGGKPRHRIELPPWDIWDTHSVYEWSRQNFPELPLNLRWSKERLVRTVEAYLDTPQVRTYAQTVSPFHTQIPNHHLITDNRSPHIHTTGRARDPRGSCAALSSRDVRRRALLRELQL